MKNLLIAFAFIATVSVATAQSKNDPTYSRNNYKQLNKANKAKELKNDGVEAEGYTKEKTVASRNYKSQNNLNRNESGAIVLTVPVEKKTQSLASSRNYKSSFGKNKANHSLKSQSAAPAVADAKSE